MCCKEHVDDLEFPRHFHWSLDTWIEIAKVVASDAAGTWEPGNLGPCGCLIAIECQNPQQHFASLSDQAAVEKTADDPRIDCLRSNATTRSLHRHVHYLADATTFPGQVLWRIQDPNTNWSQHWARHPSFSSTSAFISQDPLSHRCGAPSALFATCTS